MDAELDELGVDGGRGGARDAHDAVPELGAARAPVERLVLHDAAVLQAVPLRARLRVLGARRGRSAAPLCAGGCARRTKWRTSSCTAAPTLRTTVCSRLWRPNTGCGTAKM